MQTHFGLSPSYVQYYSAQFQLYFVQINSEIVQITPQLRKTGTGKIRRDGFTKAGKLK